MHNSEVTDDDDSDDDGGDSNDNDDFIRSDDDNYVYYYYRQYQYKNAQNKIWRLFNLYSINNAEFHQNSLLHSSHLKTFQNTLKRTNALVFGRIVWNMLQWYQIHVTFACIFHHKWHWIDYYTLHHHFNSTTIEEVKMQLQISPHVGPCLADCLPLQALLWVSRTLLLASIFPVRTFQSFLA